MEKILSIIVPTYNMEALLPRCLESLIVPDEYMKFLEVLVVNDGSKDNSSKIAHEYADKYSDTIKVIDKSNGNYGSCINVALKIATGKYIRICDADDCYRNENLEKYLEFLRQTDTDIVFTPYETYFGDRLESTFGVAPSLCGRTWLIDDLKWDTPELICFRAMHCMATKRDVLIRYNYFQSEGISYTDTQFIFYSDLYSSTCSFFAEVIYVYYLGRDGQTMSQASMIKSHMHFYENAKKMVTDYVKIDYPISENRAKLLEMSIANCLIYFIVVVLCQLSNPKEKLQLLEELLISLDLSNKISGINSLLLRLKSYKLWRVYKMPPIIIRMIFQIKNVLRRHS